MSFLIIKKMSHTRRHHRRPALFPAPLPEVLHLHPGLQHLDEVTVSTSTVPGSPRVVILSGILLLRLPRASMKSPSKRTSNTPRLRTILVNGRRCVRFVFFSAPRVRLESILSYSMISHFVLVHDPSNYLGRFDACWVWIEHIQPCVV